MRTIYANYVIRGSCPLDRKKPMRRSKTSDKNGVTRRDFLKNAGTGLVAADLAGTSPAKAKAGPVASPVRFTPQDKLTQISSNLYWLRDTCNVYVLKDGN